MKILSSVFKRKRFRPIIVIDIGSASVGGAVVYPSAGSEGGPLITKAVRRPLKLSDNLSLRPFVNSLLEAEKAVVEELISAKDYVKPRAVHLFLPSIFTVNQTKTVNYQADGQQFSVTKKLLETLIEQIKEEFKADWPKLFRSLVDDQSRLLDVEILRVKLNGYNTNQPIGQMAQELSLTVFISLTSEAVTDKFWEPLALWSSADHFSHSFSLAAYRVFKEKMGSTASFVIMDVTGELSDLLLIRRGLMSATASFPLGKNFILRQVAEKLNTTLAESQSRLRLFRQGKLESQAHDRLAKILEEVKADWLEELSKALETLKQTYLLPEEILIIGDDLVCRLFADWLNRAGLDNFTLSRRPLLARFVQSQLLADGVRSAVEIKDPFLLTTSLFCHYRS